MLLVSQTEISGKHFKDEQSKNKEDIFFTLDIFHLEMSGKYFKE